MTRENNMIVIWILVFFIIEFKQISCNILDSLFSDVFWHVVSDSFLVSLDDKISGRCGCSCRKNRPARHGCNCCSGGQWMSKLNWSALALRWWRRSRYWNVKKQNNECRFILTLLYFVVWGISCPLLTSDLTWPGGDNPMREMYWFKQPCDVFSSRQQALT